MASPRSPNKSAGPIGKIQKANKSAEQIGEVGRIRPPIWGGGGGGVGLILGQKNFVYHTRQECPNRIGVADVAPVQPTIVGPWAQGRSKGERESNGQFSLTECPRHRPFQPVVQ